MPSTETQHTNLILSWRRDANKYIADTIPSIRLSNQQRHFFDELTKLIQTKLKASRGEELTEEEQRYARALGISVMSGKGTGKDTAAALAILYFLSCFPYPKIGATAPTGHQLKDVLWSEISKWLAQSAVKDWLVWQTEKVYFKELKGERWFAVARTTNLKGSAEEQAATLAGLHEDYMALVVDEAQGVPGPVYNEIEGAMTGKCNFGLLIFNPSRSKCYAVDTHYRDRDRWIPIRWNAEESELVTKASIEQKARRGRDSNYYRWAVLGLPPISDENLLIPNDWVMDAIDREVEPLDTDVEVFGIDVGAGGDESALIRRRGPKIPPIEGTNTPHSEELTGWILRRIAQYEPEVVFIDSIGIGWGIAGNLRSRCQTRIIDVNVAEMSSDDTRFFRLRDQLWWSVRGLFEHGAISIPDDPLLIAELTSIRFQEDSAGKIKVEGRKDMIKRGVESPNRASAIVLTEFYSSELLRRMKKPGGSDWRKAENPSWRVV